MNDQASTLADQFDLTEGLIAGKIRVADEFERKYILYALGFFQGNITRAARVAEMDRSNFLRAMRKHEIRGDEFRIGDEP